MNINLFDNTEGVVCRESVSSFRQSRMDCTESPEYNGETSAFPAQTPIAMAYVPFQKWGETKLPDTALSSGTLFSELDFPFEGSNCEKGGVRR